VSKHFRPEWCLSCYSKRPTKDRELCNDCIASCLQRRREVDQQPRTCAGVEGIYQLDVQPSSIYKRTRRSEKRGFSEALFSPRVCRVWPSS
jgi:hypothetical protein